MAVSFNWERVKCWKCGYNENILQFVMELEDVRYGRAKEIINNTAPSDFNLDVFEELPNIRKFDTVQLPVGFNTILEGEGILGKRARNYMKARGYDLEKLDMMGFGYCNKHDEDYYLDFFGRIIVPFKADGRLVYYIGRTFMEGEERYKNPPTDTFGVGKGDLIFNEDAINIQKRCMVVEGWADALTLGDEGISTQGWSLSSTQKTKMLRGTCETYVFVPDKGFYLEAVKTALDFIEEKKVYVVETDNILPHYPHKKDANELGLENILEELDKTPPLTLSKAMGVIM
jgi:DNA primase